MFGAEIRDRLPPSVRRRDTLLHALARVQARGPGDLRAACERLALLPGRRGIAVLVSDFYCEPEDAFAALDALRLRGHDVIAFHVLDPMERDLQIKDPVVLEDLETGQRMPVTPAARERYGELVDVHIETLRKGCRERDMDYACLVTDQPLDEMLWHYLFQRARLSRVR